MNELKQQLNQTTQQRPTSSTSDSFLYGSNPSGGMSFLSNLFTSDNNTNTNNNNSNSNNNLVDENSDHYHHTSFSDLLAATIVPTSPKRVGGGPNDGFGFKRNKPDSLVLPMTFSTSAFVVSPGFSPSTFLTSPTLFSSSLNPYSMSCQPTTLAQMPSQTALSQPHIGIQTEFYSPASALNPIPSTMAFHSSAFITQPTQPTSSVPRQPQNLPAAVDKPADDGFNWRKYGQKQVKGSEYPRSYYKCTTPNCPVKKKVERSYDGHITEIIYKGQHNHAPPQNGRRGRDGSDGQIGNFQLSCRLGRDSDLAQATSIQLHGPSDSEESGENYQQTEDEEDDYDEDEPNAKRRNVGFGNCDIPFTHRTMTEPKIVVQTRSEIDLLDDGYRWRKYGQKVVKGNPNPRSYYKCTTVGCKVRKHVERASTDTEAVITTYEGKHNHDLPAARGSTMINSSNIESKQSMLNNSVTQMNFGNKNQLPISLRLKEEQVLV